MNKDPAKLSRLRHAREKIETELKEAKSVEGMASFEVGEKQRKLTEAKATVEFWESELADFDKRHGSVYP